MEDEFKELQKYLSPGARAMLRILKDLEAGTEFDLYTRPEEVEVLERYVESYRGTLLDKTLERLNEVLELGVKHVITQADLMREITREWQENVSKMSKVELETLSGAFKYPGVGLAELSRKTDLSYAQTRRAYQRLNTAEVLKVEALLSAERLGLIRTLLILENPQLLLSGPYVTKHLFVDGATQLVFQTAMLPRDRLPELLNMVRSLRNVASSVTVWKLSVGRPRFSGLYYNRRRRAWWIDLFHWRLQLRHGDQLTIGQSPTPSSRPAKFTASELAIIDYLLENFDSTGSEIATATNLSESTSVRKRASLIEERTIIPRTRVDIPQLSERIVAVLSQECAGDIISAWNLLPLNYMSRIENIENAAEKKIILLSSVPSGFGNGIIRVLDEEMSRLDDYSAHVVSAGAYKQLKTVHLFDRRSKKWKYDVALFEARAASVVRKEAESSGNIPLDIA